MPVVKVIIWEEKGIWFGYLQDFPDYWTQGETIEDLRENLKDLHADLTGGHIPGARHLEDLVV